MAEDWLQQAVQDEIGTQRQGLRAASLGQGDVTLAPDQAARVWADGDAQGVAPGVALRNADAVAAEAERRRLDAITTRNPALADWLAAKPERMAIARDDVDQLDTLTGTLRQPPMSGVRRFWERLKAGALTTVGGLTEAAGDYVHELFDPLAQIMASRAQFNPASVPIAAQVGQAHAVADVGGVVAAKGADIVDFGTKMRAAAAEGVTRPASLGDVLQRPGNAGNYYGGLVADSTFPMLLSILTRSPLGGAAMAGVTTAGQQYGQYRAEGTAPGDAASAALDQGLLEAVFSHFPLAEAFGGGRLLPRIARTAAKEAGSEAATQVTQDVAEARDLGRPISAGQVLADAIDAAIVGGAMGPTEAIGGAHGAEDLRVRDGRAVLQEAERVVRSVDDVTHLGALQEAAKAAKTVDRSPAEVEALVRHVVDQAPGTPTHVYLDAQQLATYFQSANLDADAEVARITGDPDALSVAQAGGGDVVVPIERYLARVPKSPHAEALLDMARLAPDRASNAELRDLNLGEMFARFAPESAAPATEGEAGAPAPVDPVEEVAREVQAQLVDAGVESSAAAAQAQLLAQRYATRAARRGNGETALDVYRAANVAVRRGSAQATPVSAEQAPGATLEQAPTTNPKDGPAGAALRDRVTQDFDAVAGEYAALSGEYDTQGGRILNTDFARELSPEYRADRTRSADVHEAASDFVKELYRRKLAEPTPAGLDPVVVFSAGGTGAGKTTGLQAADFGEPEIVYDTNMNRLGSAVDKIEQALAAGRDVRIIYTYREPVEALRNGALPRAMRQGRTVPLAEHLRTHVGASTVIRELAARYADDPRVEIAAVDNSRGKGNQAVTPLESLPQVEDNNLREQLRASLEEARSAGEISDAVYRGFAGDAAQAPQRGGDGGSDRREPSPQDGRTEDLTPPPGGVSVSGALNQPADGAAAPRGRITLGPNGERTIELLDGADLSTFHHETGHLFLEELVQDAFAPNAAPQLREDLDTLLAWWGKDARAADGREAVQAAIGRDQHEQFARGYEAYLFEGKAPSPRLVDLFARFRSWLLSVYRSLRGLNVHLSDEVRGVYDRLLATDEEIDAATVRQGYVPLDLPPDVRGVVPEGQWRQYEAMLTAATEEARQEVQQKLLDAQRREAKAWWRERRAEVRAQVETEAHARPDFQAVSVLSRGKLADGSPAPEGLAGISLNREALVERYGERFVIDRLGPKKVYRKTGGVTPETAAGLLGFRDGGALVEALVNARPMREWIEGETDTRMRAQYPDPLLDGSLPERALAAVHNDKRLQALEAELALLAQVAKQPALPPRMLGAAARQRIAGMKRRDIRPNDYLVAERRAARQATQAAAGGRYAEALQFKRQQALSAHLYRAARDATADFDRAREYLARFDRKDTRARLGKAGGQYLEQIDALLERVELRPASGREIERRMSLREWVDRRAAEGEAIDVPDAVLDTARLTNLRDMPMEQVRGLVDTIKQIDHLARLKTELMLGAERRDRAEVDAELAASVRAARQARPERTGDRTRLDRVRQALDQGRAAYLRPSTLTRDLDGFEEGGAVWRHTVGVIQHAVNHQLNPALRQADEALAAIWREHYTLAELRRMNTAVYRPEVGDSWSKGRILALALNWGNAGNRDAILSAARGRLTPTQVAALLNTLDGRDARFVNAVWAHLEGYWPAIAAAQQRRTGLAPERVQPQPFVLTTADGAQVPMTGGYYPLKYEPDSSPKADQDEQGEFWDAIRTGRYTRAQTRNGHTKERVGSGGRTVRLDIGVLGQHVRDVLRDLHLGDAVNYVHRVVQGSEFRDALTEVGKLEYGRALDLWLRDVAVGEMAPRTFFERMARRLRTNFTASVLTFNVASALIQPSGLVQSGALLGWGTLRTGLRRLLTEPWVGKNSVFATIDAASPMMAKRAKESVEAVQQVATALAGRRGMFLRKYQYAMMARMQRIADTVTWLGAEAKGLDQFDGDLTKARAYADDAVQRAQASGEFMDKSAIERGTLGENVRQSEFVRASTALMSYMIAKGNAVYERTRTTDFRNPGQVARYTVDVVALFVIEQLLMDAVRGGLPSDRDDDGSTWDDWLAYLGGSAVSNVLGTLPGIAQLASEMRGYSAQTMVQRFYHLVAGFEHQIEQGEADKAAVKSAVSVAGAVTGLPSAQANRTLDAIWDASEGQDVPLPDYLLGRPREQKK